MFELIRKVPFSVHHQGIVSAHLITCFACADLLDVGRPDSAAVHEWRDSPATGGRLVRAQVYNKGSESGEPACPLCGGSLERHEWKGEVYWGGAELGFRLWHVQDHDETFEEVASRLERIQDSWELALEQEEYEYADWCRDELRHLENLKSLMLL